MSEILDKELLTVGDVAGYMGVGPVTVYRWCREGRLLCSKVGKSWRIRRETLEDFLRRGERPVTLESRLRSFLAVPDSVIAVASDVDLLHRLDAAFFRIGEARGGVLVKYHGGEPQASADDLRAELERHGLGWNAWSVKDGSASPTSPRRGIGPERCAVYSTRRRKAGSRCGPASTGRSAWISPRPCASRMR